MSHLFYLFGLIYLIRELIDLVNPIKFTKKMESLHKFVSEEKTFKSKAFSDLNAEDKNLIWYSVLSILVIAWAALGLLTANWIIFVAFLVFGFVIYNPISKLVRKLFGFGKAYVMLHIFGTLVDILLVGFAIINQYHLKIDLVKVFFP